MPYDYPLTPDTLPAFVAAVDAAGGLGAPAAQPLLEGFCYTPQTAVDIGADPFGTVYFDGQAALYTELSGRRALDQEAGEQYAIDVASRLGHANPYGSDDTAFLARHGLAVLAALRAADPGPRARVLDMGAGWGLSSEILAFAGARVTALDINPRFVDLITRRAATRRLPITAHRGNFDTARPPGGPFDMIFFYECLHHALRPWETLAHAATMLAPGGAVVMAGEPVNALWWPHWGLRLDAASVYCIHKFGWFESGFSAPFLKACCARAGLQAQIVTGAGLDGAEICVARRPGEDTDEARAIPLPPGGVLQT